MANRLHRCAVTWHVIVQQLDILETMSPLDFLDFRDFLFPASGFQVCVQTNLFQHGMDAVDSHSISLALSHSISRFQSVQFRLLENKLGLKRAARLNYQKGDYTQPLQPEHKALIEHIETQSSLFDLIEQWLERTPFMSDDVRLCGVNMGACD